jgi:bacterioferritin
VATPHSAGRRPELGINASAKTAKGKRRHGRACATKNILFKFRTHAHPTPEEINMKGNQKLIDVLNQLLADELTAINQYMVHSELCANWGYERLHKVIEKRAFGEMKHAEKLIARIVFLEGAPVVSKLNPLHIGADVPQMIANDIAAELTALRGYNSAIPLALEVQDAPTRELLESIIKDEDGHLDMLESQRDQIAQMSVGVFLGQQIEAD